MSHRQPEADAAQSRWTTSGTTTAAAAEPRPALEAEANGWDPELIESLHGLLHDPRCLAGEMDGRLEELSVPYGDGVYSALVFLMCHLRFSPEEARDHWSRIVAHRIELEGKVGGPVDPRVALVSYFLQVNRKFDNPILIELRLLEKTRQSAYRDELTGLYNYRFFTENLGHEVRRADRFNQPLSLVMIDVDDFKPYNDSCGHEAGNEILATVASLLAASLRRIDVAARYGGEEFALLLPSTPKIGAQLVAERIRAAVERHDFPGEDRLPRGRLTVSVGVATWPADAREPGELLRRADRAMYEAKSGGKNQVCLWGHSFRSYRRIELELDGSLRTIEGSPSCALRTLNVSERGALFVAGQQFEPGALVELELQLPDAEKPLAIVARVTSCERHHLDEFETGVRIMEMKREDQARLQYYLRDMGSPPDQLAEEPAGGGY